MTPAEFHPSKPTILMTGASGALARLVSQALAPKYNLVGVDPRPAPSASHFPGDLIVTDYSHRRLDEVFRKYKFDGLIHLGRIRESNQYSPTARFQMNVVGTKKLLELCLEHDVRRSVVLGTYHVYGAHRLNNLYMTEESPLRASQSFPELADAVELDHASTTFLWRHRDFHTTVLRPVNIVGKHVRNTICTLLRSGICPKVLGFDPLMQFIDEKDMARALILAFEGKKSGVYNVAGEGVIAYSDAITAAKALAVPVPPIGTTAFSGLLSAFKIDFPKYLLQYFKYPVVLNDECFRKDFGYAPKVGTQRALESLGPQKIVRQFYSKTEDDFTGSGV